MSQEAALDQADVCLANGDPSGAERVLLQAFPDIERASADAQHAMAMVRLAQGNTQQAERLMRAALMVEPNSLRHNIALGHILAAQTNDTGALAAYTTAERIDPKWPGLNVVISHSLYRLERYSEAEQAARRGAASADASLALSNALRAQGKSKEALAAADDALTHDWQNADAQHARATALMDLGRPQEALEIYEGLTGRGIDVPALQMNKGAALEALGRKADARALYEDAARKWPNLPNLQDRVAAARKRV